MAVDAAQIRLVRESLPSIREHRVPVSMNFYDNLFALAPELRAMFRSDIAGQGMRFMTTLATIADLLEALTNSVTRSTISPRPMRASG